MIDVIRIESYFDQYMLCIFNDHDEDLERKIFPTFLEALDKAKEFVETYEKENKDV